MRVVTAVGRREKRRRRKETARVRVFVTGHKSGARKPLVCAADREKTRVLSEFSIVDLARDILLSFSVSRHRIPAFEEREITSKVICGIAVHRSIDRGQGSTRVYEIAQSVRGIRSALRGILIYSMQSIYSSDKNNVLE